MTYRRHLDVFLKCGRISFLEVFQLCGPCQRADDIDVDVVSAPFGSGINFWYKDTSAKTGGLKATVGNAFDPVKLSWGKAADDVTGYRVYRYDEKQKKYVYMKQTSGKSFTDTDVTSGKTYQYRVRCFWTIGGTNYYGNYSSVVSATVPPAKVSDVKTQKRSSTYVTLGWSKISGSSGYRVYKYNTAEKKYESVATIAGGAVSIVRSCSSKITESRTIP